MGTKRKTTYKPFSPNILRAGDTILITSDGGFFSTGIELKQRKAGFSLSSAKYTHVEMSGGGSKSVRIAPPRAKVIDITKVYAGRYIKIRRHIYEDWEENRHDIAWTNATLCNTRYDKRGILGFIFTWIKQHVSRWFCSEGFLYSLQTKYPNELKGMEPSKCMPAHFASSPGLTTVWEGYIPKKV